MNQSQMEDFIRTQADADDADAPSSLLQIYTKAAYNDIKRRVHRWPDKHQRHVMATVAGTYLYQFDTFVPTDLEYITAIQDPDSKQLQWVPLERFVELRESATTGRPRKFAADRAGLYVWPTPTAAENFVVHGYRKFADWPSGSSEPDLAREFDEAICWYALSKFYLQQEDLELSQLYMGLYEKHVNTQIEAALRTSAGTAAPMVFGNQSVHLPTGMGYERFVRMNTEG